MGRLMPATFLSDHLSDIRAAPLDMLHLVDMPVIVRHQDRGALRLDHRHDQALCRRRLGDLVFNHRHNAADRVKRCGHSKDFGHATRSAGNRELRQPAS